MSERGFLIKVNKICYFYPDDNKPVLLLIVSEEQFPQRTDIFKAKCNGKYLKFAYFRIHAEERSRSSVGVLLKVGSEYS